MVNLPVERDLTDTPARQCILVVDDARSNQLFLGAILEPYYEVLTAGSGIEALEAAISSPRPDLILLDVSMPKMDGYDVLLALRRDVRTSDIPVIFVTSLDSSHDEKAGLDMGAVDYIAKPVCSEIVLARVKNHLALHHRTKMLREISEKLSHYLAPQVYQMIFQDAKEQTTGSKRKKLTVFFSDLKDFTQTTEELQPEDLTALLNNYLDEMSKIAFDFGATVDKFVGDAILIFFGDPGSFGIKEDAQRCVQMAIAMQQRMKDLREQWRLKGFVKPLRMRIGINTGFCNVGNFGSAQRMDYTVIGTEVNLAARLEQACDPDGILLSYETYSLVQDRIQAIEQPPVSLKGIHREVRTFAVKIDPEDIDSLSRPAQKVRPGLHAILDLDTLPDSLHQAAIEDLEDLITRIRGLR